MAKFPRAPLTYTQLKTLAKHIVDFIDHEEVSCAEAIVQRDSVMENAPLLLEALFNSVGYYQDPEFNEELDGYLASGYQNAVPYVMRSTHGAVIEGTKVLVWRTEHSGIKVRVFVSDVIERMGKSSPRLLGKRMDDTIIFDYAGAQAWHIADVEPPREGSKPL